MKLKMLSFCILLLLGTQMCLSVDMFASVRKSVSYYVDSANGNDRNNGKSESSPFKSLKKISSLKLKGGDRVLLKKGTSVKGVLELSFNGEKGNPVVIGAYGNGVKPRIIGKDDSEYAVRILNSNYVTLRDIEIINHGSTDLSGRTGVKVENWNNGTSKGITLSNLTIRDVNGVLSKKKGGGSGILIVNGGDEKISVYDGLLIEYCHIKNCQRNAIIWKAYSNRQNWHPNRNVVVRGNLIEGVPGDGIVPIGCDGALVEYNVMRDCPATLVDGKKEAAAGIWPWSCDNTIIRYNEVSDHKAPWDGQGFDSDWNCRNTIIEYNYSHNNYGGIVLVCNNGAVTKTSVGNVGSIVRYNISIGDGVRPEPTRGKMFSPGIHFGGPTKNTLIYRNIVHLNKKKGKMDRTMITLDNWSGYADSTRIEENVFYSHDVSNFKTTKSTNNVFKGNYYIGKYNNMPDDGNSHKDSDVYRREILSKGGDGYSGLSQLMDSVKIASDEYCKYVSKEKIETFFGRLR